MKFACCVCDHTYRRTRFRRAGAPYSANASSRAAPRYSRIGAIGEVASGFVYYVSVKGVTGAGNLDVETVGAKLDAIRAQIAR